MVKLKYFRALGLLGMLSVADCSMAMLMLEDGGNIDNKEALVKIDGKSMLQGYIPYTDPLQMASFSGSGAAVAQYEAIRQDIPVIAKDFDNFEQYLKNTLSNISDKSNEAAFNSIKIAYYALLLQAGGATLQTVRSLNDMVRTFMFSFAHLANVVQGGNDTATVEACAKKAAGNLAALALRYRELPVSYKSPMYSYITSMLGIIYKAENPKLLMGAIYNALLSQGAASTADAAQLTAIVKDGRVTVADTAIMLRGSDDKDAIVKRGGGNAEGSYNRLVSDFGKRLANMLGYGAGGKVVLDYKKALEDVRFEDDNLTLAVSVINSVTSDDRKLMLQLFRNLGKEVMDQIDNDGEGGSRWRNYMLPLLQAGDVRSIAKFMQYMGSGPLLNIINVLQGKLTSITSDLGAEIITDQGNNGLYVKFGLADTFFNLLQYSAKEGGIPVDKQAIVAGLLGSIRQKLKSFGDLPEFLQHFAFDDLFFRFFITSGVISNTPEMLLSNSLGIIRMLSDEKNSFDVGLLTKIAVDNGIKSIQTLLLKDKAFIKTLTSGIEKKALPSVDDDEDDDYGGKSSLVSASFD
ncbi:MAG: hypothetical protein LBP41_03230 [Holosporaceae bacterium]|jgi:hypothetical protein|nr:hypothetical protein [Holosporaceae bacterium]